MVRFFGFFLFFSMLFGLFIHAHMEFPSFLSWVGSLPGDLIIRKKDLTIYLPLTSSFILSALVSLLLSLVSGSKS